MRTQNAAVKDFANMLVTDHEGHLEALRKMAGEHDVDRQALASNTAGAAAIRALSNLQSMAADSGSTVNSSAIRSNTTSRSSSRSRCSVARRRTTISGAT